MYNTKEDNKMTTKDIDYDKKKLRETFDDMNKNDRIKLDYDFLRDSNYKKKRQSKKNNLLFIFFTTAILLLFFTLILNQRIIVDGSCNITNINYEYKNDIPNMNIENGDISCSGKIDVPLIFLGQLQ